ncbi:hypothetical protein HFN89_05765 [Rhizobium laguerreae]|nr:hypothetical protein [Rhizobium laguerreae]
MRVILCALFSLVFLGAEAHTADRDVLSCELNRYCLAYNTVSGVGQECPIAEEGDRRWRLILDHRTGQAVITDAYLNKTTLPFSCSGQNCSGSMDEEQIHHDISYDKEFMELKYNYVLTYQQGAKNMTFKYIGTCKQ